MKEGIHPVYKKSTVTCVCGNVFETRSTTGNIHVEICASCHPFYTGKQKLLDSAGRVEKFKKKYAGKTAEAKASVAGA
jgi:large subunit ribosomal protein L31